MQIRPVLFWFFCWVLPVAVAAQEPAPPELPAATKRVEVEEVALTVRIDPPRSAIYGKAVLEVRNRSGEPLPAVGLRIPAPLGPAVVIKAVWDRNDDLPWRRAREREAEGEFQLQVTLLRPLRAGHKVRLAISFDLQLEKLDSPAPTVVQVTPSEARLGSLGWYPVPAGHDDPLPSSLRLTVRLPKSWDATSPVKLKRGREHTLLVAYELKTDRPEPGVILFEGRAPQPQ